VLAALASARLHDRLISIAGHAGPHRVSTVISQAHDGSDCTRCGGQQCLLMPFAPHDPEARLRVAALEQGLRDLGWVDSRNLRIDYRWATDDSDHLRGEAAAVVAAAPDVIIANSTPVLSDLRKRPRCRWCSCR
jgi:hypothetical protein